MVLYDNAFTSMVMVSYNMVQYVGIEVCCRVFCIVRTILYHIHDIRGCCHRSKIFLFFVIVSSSLSLSDAYRR